MSEQKHTPLKVEGSIYEHMAAEIVGERGIAQVWNGPDALRYAHMFAAAPEMLEALKAVMEEKAPRYHDCTDDGLPKCAWCLADEAIAKAEGRQP